MLLKSCLTDSDSVVHTLSHSANCIAMLEKQNMDLIVLDINMPSPNGFELAQTLKSDGRFSEIPIVFLTQSDANKDVINKSFEMGGVDYISKPDDMFLLKKKLNALLRFHKDKLAAQRHAMSYRKMIKSIL